MQRILVGVDGSEPSTNAARFAAEIALRFGARLTLAYVLPRLLLPPDAYGLTDEAVEREHQDFGEKLLASAMAKLGAEPGLEVDTLVLIGAPAESLARTASAPDIDMVVVGSRGRGAVARVLLGSIADRLVHISPKPVLVVR